MGNKVRDFIYLDAKRCISLHSIKIFYWGTFLIPFMLIVMGIAGKKFFPIISVLIWSLLYWVFVAAIQSRHVKKTFSLRFLVNGMAGLFMSSLFIIFFVSFGLVSGILDKIFIFWFLFFYVLFIVLYFTLIVIGVHKGVYVKIKEKSRGRISLIMESLMAGILPYAGILGVYTSRIIRKTVNESVQAHIFIILSVLIIFLIGLTYINFIQYFYCIKYKITCDECGNETSSHLNR